MFQADRPLGFYDIYRVQHAPKPENLAIALGWQEHREECMRGAAIGWAEARVGKASRANPGGLYSAVRATLKEIH